MGGSDISGKIVAGERTNKRQAPIAGIKQSATLLREFGGHAEKKREQFGVVVKSSAV